MDSQFPRRADITVYRIPPAAGLMAFFADTLGHGRPVYICDTKANYDFWVESEFSGEIDLRNGIAAQPAMPGNLIAPTQEILDKAVAAGGAWTVYLYAQSPKLQYRGQPLTEVQITIVERRPAGRPVLSIDASPPILKDRRVSSFTWSS